MGQTVSRTSGDDTLQSRGGDTVRGKAGRDTLVATDVRGLAFDPMDPSSGTVTFIDDSTPFFSAIENFLFDDTRDGIVEDADAIGPGFVDDAGRGIDAQDAILPGHGRDHDVVEARADDDTVNGNDGHDTLDGGAGADRLYGTDDGDALRGGAGDEVDGGEGGRDNDTLMLARGTRVVDDPFLPENGVAAFRDGSTLTFRNIEHVVIPCFTPGTMIQTDRGEVAVEDIAVGHRVLTRDRGYQSIVWVGRRQISRAEMAANPHLVAVRIEQGALGQDMPTRDMYVSPQQRLLAQGPRTKLLFGETEVLVPALHLVGYPGITRADVAGTTYIHIMCAKHEVIWSDGIWTDSFQPDDLTLAGLDAAQRFEIEEIFPSLRHDASGFAAARRTLRRHEADLLLS
jgi:hypothetical protein